jgi:hypothetical protein
MMDLNQVIFVYKMLQEKSNCIYPKPLGKDVIKQLNIKLKTVDNSLIQKDFNGDDYLELRLGDLFEHMFILSELK